MLDTDMKSALPKFQRFRFHCVATGLPALTGQTDKQIWETDKQTDKYDKQTDRPPSEHE